jgi:transposase InsO family protein
MTRSTGNPPHHSRTRSLESRIPGNGSVRFGGRPGGKGPAQLAPRCPADPTRTLADEWAYARPYTTETERRALDPWLHTYNHHRGHTALKGQPPASRVTNLSGHNS